MSKLEKTFHASLTSNSSLHEDTNLSTKFMAELSPQTCISGHGRPIKKTKSKTSVIDFLWICTHHHMTSKITLCNNHKFLSKLKSTFKGRLLQHFIQDLKIRGYQEIFPNFSLGIFSLGINSNQEQMKVFTKFRGFYLILGCYV